MSKTGKKPSQKQQLEQIASQLIELLSNEVSSSKLSHDKNKVKEVVSNIEEFLKAGKNPVIRKQLEKIISQTRAKSPANKPQKGEPLCSNDSIYKNKPFTSSNNAPTEEKPKISGNSTETEKKTMGIMDNFEKLYIYILKKGSFNMVASFLALIFALIICLILLYVYQETAYDHKAIEIGGFQDDDKTGGSFDETGGSVDETDGSVKKVSKSLDDRVKDDHIEKGGEQNASKPKASEPKNSAVINDSAFEKPKQTSSSVHDDRLNEDSLSQHSGVAVQTETSAKPESPGSFLDKFNSFLNKSIIWLLKFISKGGTIFLLLTLIYKFFERLLMRVYENTVALAIEGGYQGLEAVNWLFQLLGNGFKAVLNGILIVSSHITAFLIYVKGLGISRL